MNRVSDDVILVCSADNLCKQFGPRSDPTLARQNVGPDLDPKCLLKDFFERVYFEKNKQATKKHKKYPVGSVNNRRQK